MAISLKNFGFTLIVASLTLAPLFSACSENGESAGVEKDQAVSFVSGIVLPDGSVVACDDDREGVVADVGDAGYRKCKNGRWIRIGTSAAMMADEIIGQVVEEENTDDLDDESEEEPLDEENESQEAFALPFCSRSLNGTTIENPDNGKTYRCKDGVWYAEKSLGSSSSQKVSSSSARSSSSVMSSSSSSSLKQSSSSVASSSSQKVSSSSANSSSSVRSSSSSSSLKQSSSSVASSSSQKVSSSSARSSSSVRSSSSSSSLKQSSSSVIPAKSNWLYLNKNITYGEFTDSRDGQVYKTITVGTQTWMAENLNYALDPGIKSWCGGGNGKVEGDCSVYGRLYTWTDAMNECPQGWHLPSDKEWYSLLSNDAIGGTSTAGLNMKANVTLWSAGNKADAVGFSALPAGTRSGSTGSFESVRNSAGFWSATAADESRANYWYMNIYNDVIFQDFTYRNTGRSVRCLKD